MHDIEARSHIRIDQTLIRVYYREPRIIKFIRLRYSTVFWIWELGQKIAYKTATKLIVLVTDASDSLNILHWLTIVFLRSTFHAVGSQFWTHCSGRLWHRSPLARYQLIHQQMFRTCTCMRASCRSDGIIICLTFFIYDYISIHLCDIQIYSMVNSTWERTFYFFLRE